MDLKSQSRFPTVRSTGNIKFHFDLVPLTLTALTFSASSYNYSMILPGARLLFVTVFLKVQTVLLQLRFVHSLVSCLLCWLIGHLKIRLLFLQELGP